jgi:glycine/D-amino acid oxidase-like deaminating enzyme
MGVSTAHFLSKRQVRTAVLDKGVLGGRASGANPGSLSVQNKPIELVQLSIEGVDFWQELSDRYPELGYKRLGGLRVAENEEELEKLAASVKQQAKQGLKIELLEPAEVRQEAPYLSDHLIGANYCALDGKSNSRVAVKKLAVEADSNYVDYYPRHDVLGVEPTGEGYRATVRYKGRKLEFQAPVVLLATGVNTPATAPWFDLEVEMRVRINQVMVTKPADIRLDHMVTHAGGHLTAKISDHGSVLIGGGWPGEISPITGHVLPSFESTVGLSTLAQRVIPQLAETLIVRSWAEVDGRCRKQLPVFGPIPKYEGAYIMTSCFGGYVLGPLFGKFMAALITEGELPAAMEPFLPANS